MTGCWHSRLSWLPSMITDIDESPVHRLRLHPRSPAFPRRLALREHEPLAPERWLYAAMVAVLTLIAANRFFALAHVR